MNDTPPEGGLPRGHPALFNPFFNMLQIPLYRVWIYRVKLKGNARDKEHEADLNNFIQEHLVEQGYLLNRVVPQSLDNNQLVLLLFGDYNPGVALHIQSERRCQSDRDLQRTKLELSDPQGRLSLPPEPADDDETYPELIPTPPPNDPARCEEADPPEPDDVHESPYRTTQPGDTDGQEEND